AAGSRAGGGAQEGAGAQIRRAGPRHPRCRRFPRHHTRYHSSPRARAPAQRSEPSMTEPTPPPTAPAAHEQQIIAERRAKLAAWRETGGAYPNDFRRDAFAADLHAMYGAKSNEELEASPLTVTVAGRMLLKRVMGKASFATIKDMTG